jgi:hypothetical protein
MTLLEMLQDPNSSKFTLDKVQFTFPSLISRLAVANNSMLVAMQKTMLRIELELADAVTEIKTPRSESNFSIGISKMGSWLGTAEGVFQNGKRISKLAVSALSTQSDVLIIGCPDGSAHRFAGGQWTRVAMVGELITGVACIQNIVLISTLNSLHTFTSTASGWIERDVQEMQATKLGVQWAPTPFGPTVGWITEAGILHATITNDVDAILKDVVVLPLPIPQEDILQIVISDFYTWLITSKGSVMINRINQETLAVNVELGEGEQVVDGCCDVLQKTFWIATNHCLYEVLVSDEGGGMVDVLLQKRMYEDALHIGNADEKRYVASKYADECFSKGDLERAANLYAQSDTWFEKVVLKLMDQPDKSILISYLKQRLSGLKETDRSQIVMITSLLVETLLSEMDVHQANVEQEQKYSILLKDLLRHYKTQIHAPTIYSLMRQHGYNTGLLFTAELLKDDPVVIEMHIQHQEWTKALEILGKQSNPELFYRYGPILIQHAPNPTITLWTRCEFLNPRLLIPAMLYYQQSGEKNQIILYLEEVVRRGNSDKVVHNYLVQLYIEGGKDNVTRLLEFIKFGEPIFDVQYALRLCIHHALVEPCVTLYGVLHMEKEAVKLALKVSRFDEE